jgi:hypothetical protein
MRCYHSAHLVVLFEVVVRVYSARWRDEAGDGGCRALFLSPTPHVFEDLVSNVIKLVPLRRAIQLDQWKTSSILHYGLAREFFVQLHVMDNQREHLETFVVEFERPPQGLGERSRERHYEIWRGCRENVFVDPEDF